MQSARPSETGRDNGESTMNVSPHHSALGNGQADLRPILIVPYMWIGDFVRCHSVVKLLKAQSPDRPVDFLTTANNAPLLDYMPGARKGIVWDLPRKRLALTQQHALAARLRQEGYGQALIMPRTWKATLAPFLAGIPVRTGFFGEARIGVLNDLRFGERALPRMIDQCAALALPKGAELPSQWPLPELVIPAAGDFGMARADESQRPSAADCPCTRRSWAVEAMAERLFRRGRRAVEPRWCNRCGRRQPERSAARSRDLRASTRHPRPHGLRSAQCHPGVGIRERRDLERLQACFTLPPPWERRPSAFLARPVLGIGPRSTRWRRLCKPMANSIAGPATSRFAASVITGACARSRPRA